ncbi:MAG TPA: RAMP superfamily CRISPR-associated protein [Thermoanaerobaculia bacterium]
MSTAPLLPSVFELARVTIEFTSPVTVGTGGGDDLVDSVCVTDANGLPAIPGTSIAGVLRHALAQGDPDHDGGIRRVFGYQDRDPQTGEPRGQSARLWTSWAQIHDQHDRPVAFRAGRERAAELSSDPVIAALRAGVLRDHVRIGAKGVVAGRGKFDELLVPAGARFTFELVVDALAADLAERFSLDKVLGCLSRPLLRLGGRTRRGLGDFKLVRVLRRRFDLARDREPWAALPCDIAAGDPAGVLERMEQKDVDKLYDAAAAARIVLEPEDFFLVGGGDVAAWGEAAGVARGDLEHVDVAPYTERAITWTDQGGQVLERPQVVLTATGIKGALRHRVAFHARAIEKQWIGDRKSEEVDLDNPGPASDAGRRAVEALFGTAKDDGEGTPGRVYLPDVRLAPPRAAVLQHVSLDRFTGGPMDGMLFGEGVAWREETGGRVATVEFDLWVDRPDDLDATARQALRRAVDDLAQGRLALGAAASRGHGYFRGEVRWNREWGGAQ